MHSLLHRWVPADRSSPRAGRDPRAHAEREACGPEDGARGAHRPGPGVALVRRGEAPASP